MNIEKNIVVGIDISENGINVLKRAFLTASNKNAKLIIVHAIDNSWYDSFISSINIEEIKDKIKDKTKKDIEKINSFNIEYSLIIEAASPSKIIIDTAKEFNASLIIIGANNKDDLGSKIFGSTTHKITQNSKTPILIVKNVCKDRYDNILGFTDLSNISLKSIRFAEYFFEQDIKVVYAYKQLNDFTLTFYNSINKKDTIQNKILNESSEKFKQFVEENDIKKSELVESFYNVNDVLLNFAEKEKNQLTVMGSSGVNNTSSFLFGSTASNLMQNLSSDVLIYVP